MKRRKYRAANREQYNEREKMYQRKRAAARKVTARLLDVPARLVKSLEHEGASLMSQSLSMLGWNSLPTL